MGVVGREVVGAAATSWFIVVRSSNMALTVFLRMPREEQVSVAGVKSFIIGGIGWPVDFSKT